MPLSIFTLLIVTPDGAPGDTKGAFFVVVVLLKRMIERFTEDVLGMSGDMVFDRVRQLRVFGIRHGKTPPSIE
jgi:hypothetical protein